MIPRIPLCKVGKILKLHFFFQKMLKLWDPLFKLLAPCKNWSLDEHRTRNMCNNGHGIDIGIKMEMVIGLGLVMEYDMGLRRRLGIGLGIGLGMGLSSLWHRSTVG